MYTINGGCPPLTMHCTFNVSLCVGVGAPALSWLINIHNYLQPDRSTGRRTTH
jgi:hypothetical protein